MKSDIESLTKTLIEIQQDQYRELPKELITEIVSIQHQYSQSKSEVMKKISKLIEAHISTQEFK